MTAMYKMVFFLASVCYRTKYWILRDYLERVRVQAYQLYKESQLFNLRWQEMGLKFAEESYEQDEHFFVDKVRKGPTVIRLRLFWDFLTKAPYNAYFIRD